MLLGEKLWWWLFVSWSLTLIYTDLRHRRVPNRLVVVGFMAQLLWVMAAVLLPAWRYPPPWSGWFMACAGFLLALLFFPLWSRRLMGAGDIKVIAVLGFLLGLAPLVLTLMLASLLAGLHALLYLMAAAWVAPQRPCKIPYAAYLAIGALSVALIPSSSPWYSWCSSWCFTGP